MKIFVYGTLKPGEINYPIYCEGKVIQVINAYTWGQLFHLSLGYPAMTAGNAKIKGFLLIFANESALSSLDELEGYSSTQSPQENEFERQKTPVYSLSDEFLGEAWVYLMTPEKIAFYQGNPVSSGWWQAKSVNS